MNFTTKVKKRKAKQRTKQTNFTESEQVGLSYSPYLTATLSQNYLVETKEFIWGESVTRVVLTGANGVNTSISKPPSNSGERVSNGITKRGKTRLRRGSRFFDYLTSKKGYKGHTSMITLTFGKQYPEDKETKKLLDNFLKRVKRKLNKPELYYLWVAERQKRGAIHFHILTPHYLPKEFINESWNDTVNNYYDKIGMSTAKQKLYPNVKKVYNAGAYMVKYCQKKGENILGNGYNMSQATSKGMKPTLNTTIIEGKYLEDTLYHFSMDNQVVHANEVATIFWKP